MRAPALACLACIVLAAPLAAQEAPAEKPLKPLSLSLPASTAECLKTLEVVVEHALDADLLDDQIDEAEVHLEKFEEACNDSRFADALAEAKAVEKLVKMNK